MATVFTSIDCAYFARRVLSLRLLSPSYAVSSLRPPPSWQKRRSTGDELIARAKANGYQRGAYRDEDGLRHCNKHVDKVKRDDDTALDHYVL